MNIEVLDPYLRGRLQEGDLSPALLRRARKSVFINFVVASLITAGIWAVVIQVLPQSWGWLLAIANIGFFLLSGSIAINLVNDWTKLDYLDGPRRWVVVMVLWSLLVLVFRSVLVEILEDVL